MLGTRLCDPCWEFERQVLGATLYGFFYNYNVYESAPVLVSLHASKRGALRAMIAHQSVAWKELRRKHKPIKGEKLPRWRQWFIAPVMVEE